MLLLFPEGQSQWGCLFPNIPHVCCGERRGPGQPTEGKHVRYCSRRGSQPWLGNPGLSTLSTRGIQDQLRGWIRTQNLAGQRKVASPYPWAFPMVLCVYKHVCLTFTFFKRKNSQESAN